MKTLQALHFKIIHLLCSSQTFFSSGYEFIFLTKCNSGMISLELFQSTEAHYKPGTFKPSRTSFDMSMVSCFQRSQNSKVCRQRFASDVMDSCAYTAVASISISYLNHTVPLAGLCLVNFLAYLTVFLEIRFNRIVTLG